MKLRNYRLNESDKGKWFIVKLIDKDDLRRALSGNNNYVIASNCLVYADDEDSAIELAATQVSNDNEFDYWEDAFILYSIKFPKKEDYDHGRKKIFYDEVYISKRIKDQLDDDDSDNNDEFDELGLRKIDTYDLPRRDYDDDVYYGYDESYSGSSTPKKIRNYSTNKIN